MIMMMMVMMGIVLVMRCECYFGQQNVHYPYHFDAISYHSLPRPPPTGNRSQCRT